MRLKRLKRIFGARDREDDAGKKGLASMRRRQSVLRNFLISRQVVNVIDVGANRGQFATRLRAGLDYQGQITSIEPLPDAFAELQRVAGTDDRWSVLNLALGDAEAILPLNISGNSVSSSILPILDRCVRSAPGSAYIRRVDVPVRRLDSLPELRAAAAERCLLKIDAQGYEHKVLQGAEGVIDGLSLLYLESSLVPLYEGELLIEEMIAYLRHRKFAPVDISPGYFDKSSGQQLQANILFARV